MSIGAVAVVVAGILVLGGGLYWMGYVAGQTKAKLTAQAAAAAPGPQPPAAMGSVQPLVAHEVPPVQQGGMVVTRPAGPDASPPYRS